MAQWRHLLAAIHRVDPGGRMAAVASASAEPPRRGGRGELELRGGRQRQCASKKRGAHSGPNPVDRAKKGCKRHVITDVHGIPLLMHCTPANVRDDVPFLEMLDSMPPVKMRRCGPPRYKPGMVVGDAGYGFVHIVRQVVERDVVSLLAPRKQRGYPEPVHGSGLGKVRYVVERTVAWLANFRRIVQCYERTGAAWQAFNELACCVICVNKLQNFTQQRKAA
jgi:transposase